MPVPTARLAAVVVAVAVLVLVTGGAPAVVVGANVAVLVVVVLDLVLTSPPGTVEFERSVPEVLTAGGTGELTWRVANPSDRRLRVAVGDDLAPSLGAERRRLWLTLPPRSATEVVVGLAPTRRGRFDLVEVAVRVVGPLGLVARQADRDHPDVVRVYPTFPSRGEAELRVERARVADVGLRSTRRIGAGTEFDQLRDYSVDDEFRRIDWAATARYGRTIVRTYQAERNQQVVCLVDNGRVMAGRVDGVPRVEHAMDAAMCLTAVAAGLGDRAGLVAFDRTVRAVVPPGTGAAQLGRVTEALFDLEPVLAESDYRGAFTTTLARFRRRSLLVVLTDLVEAAMVDALLPNLPLILRSHLVVVGAVSDPVLDRWLAHPPEESADAYLAAAAAAALEERRRTVARLRGLGATVVDSPAGRLGADLADAYLAVKASARL